MGHIYEQQYENTSRAEYATQAIDFYKKAYALDPKSPVIGERLAEMYWKAQRSSRCGHRSAGNSQARSQRRADPPLAGAHLSSQPGRFERQRRANRKLPRAAIEQYKEIYRLDPVDTESALWLARLYRLRNEQDKAEEVLRGILKTDPDNEPAIEQLTQLLLDEGKSTEADCAAGGYDQPRAFAGAAGSSGRRLHADTRSREGGDGLSQGRRTSIPPSSATSVAWDRHCWRKRNIPRRWSIYEKLADLMPDDSDVYLRIAQIYRELHQLDKAEENLVKARQYAPGSLEVMYNEAMLYQAQGRYEDAIRVLVGCRHRHQGAVGGAALATAFAGDSVSATRAALSRHSELSGCGFTPTKNWGISATKKIAARAC